MTMVYCSCWKKSRMSPKRSRTRKQWSMGSVRKLMYHALHLGKLQKELVHYTASCWILLTSILCIQPLSSSSSWSIRGPWQVQKKSKKFRRKLKEWIKSLPGFSFVLYEEVFSSRTKNSSLFWWVSKSSSLTVPWQRSISVSSYMVVVR